MAGGFRAIPDPSALSLLRAVLDSTDDPVFVKDRRGCYVLLNPAALRMLGRTADEVIGRDDTLLFLDRAPAIMAFDAAVMASGEARTIEEGGMIGGVQRVLLTTKSPYRNSDGAIIGLVGVSRDITERKRAEEALRKSNVRLEAAQAQAGLGYWEFTPSTGEGYWSPELYRLWGRDPALGPPTMPEFMERVHPADHAMMLRMHDETMRSTAVHSVDIRTDPALGPIRYFHATLCCLRDADQRPVQIVGTTLEFTAQQRMFESLQERERFIERIAQANPSIMYVFDVVEQRNVYANRQIGEALGYTPAEIQAMGADFLVRLMHPDDLPGLPALLQRWSAARDGDILDVEYRMRHAAGQYRWFLGRDTVFQRTPDGRVKQIIGTATDITARKEAEEALQQSEERLRQAQKMEAVGRLAGGIAHDFNNLLTVINGYASLLLERKASGDVEHGLVEQIAEAGDRAAALTRQLLAFSRKQLVSAEVMNLNDVVGRMQKMLGRLIGENIHLTTQQAPNLRPIKADPGQIEQIILNLVINARDAMPDGGSLTIRTSNVEIGADADVPAGAYVLLAVTDTGCGMDEATRRQVFEPFFTTKSAGKGTGLGLATVQGIVKQSGGRITVHSTPGRGAAFEVCLPAVAAPAAAPAGEAAAGNDLNGTESILVVEDDDTVRRLSCAILQRYGYRVLAARAPAEALRHCSQPATSIDLMVTDVVMPHMNGRQLAHLVAGIRPDLRVLYVSGYTDDDILRHGVLDDGVPFLNKPFAAEVLARKVREVLDRR